MKNMSYSTSSMYRVSRGKNRENIQTAEVFHTDFTPTILSWEFFLGVYCNSFNSKCMVTCFHRAYDGVLDCSAGMKILPSLCE